MPIFKRSYSGPGIIHFFNEFPDESKAVLNDLKVGGTATVLGPDSREYRLTLVDDCEIPAALFDRFGLT
jgi:hypothetical protein